MEQALAMDWNDVRYFLALSRLGSVRAAGASLGVSHSTVARRVEGANYVARAHAHRLDPDIEGTRPRWVAFEEREMFDVMVADSSYPHVPAGARSPRSAC